MVATPLRANRRGRQLRRGAQTFRADTTMTISPSFRWLAFALFACCFSGCAFFPDIQEEPRYHNPFPQLHRVAILPFFNLSAEPTVNGEEVALAYYNELQLIPGFEVMPIGVAKQQIVARKLMMDEATDFQKLARDLGVDAVLVGAVTDFTPYYPPRMAIKVNWYAANPGFHPIPAGYGLPWGTSEEEFIPDEVVFEAEFALARSQLDTQTPGAVANEIGALTPLMQETPPPDTQPATDGQSLVESPVTSDGQTMGGPPTADYSGGLPPDWPDPKGFIPMPPTVNRPLLVPQRDPVITHTRTYNGHDESFTNRLSQYYYFRDDARFGGWQAYLQRSDDFIRFCCYVHLTETLASRGGASESRVVWRWPLSRYER
jgi:hypothetical protein